MAAARGPAGISSPGGIGMGWNARFEIGVHAIDLDHKLAFQTLDALLRALREGAAASALEDTINVLRAYADEHFRREEELMRTVRFPELPAHVAAHDAFRRKTFEFEISRRRSSLAASEVVRYLMEWLPDHIGNADTKIIPYVNLYRASHPNAAGLHARPPARASSARSAAVPPAASEGSRRSLGRTR